MLFLSTPSARRATFGHGRHDGRCADFYPRPPRGGRHFGGRFSGVVGQFLSTPSARRATLYGHDRWMAEIDFYPRPPRGGRPIRRRVERWINQFLSTPSARRATMRQPHPLRRAVISIHALREEGDCRNADRPCRFADISIHALREEGDILLFWSVFNVSAFLSTPSARRATVF